MSMSNHSKILIMKKLFLISVLLINVITLSAQKRNIKFQYLYTMTSDSQTEIEFSDKFIDNSMVGRSLELDVDLDYRKSYVKSDGFNYEMVNVNGFYWFSWQLTPSKFSVAPEFCEYYLKEDLEYFTACSNGANNQFILHVFTKK